MWRPSRSRRERGRGAVGSGHGRQSPPSFAPVPRGGMSTFPGATNSVPSRRPWLLWHVESQPDRRRRLRSCSTSFSISLRAPFSTSASHEASHSAVRSSTSSRWRATNTRAAGTPAGSARAAAPPTRPGPSMSVNCRTSIADEQSWDRRWPARLQAMTLRIKRVRMARCRCAAGADQPGVNRMRHTGLVRILVA